MDTKINHDMCEYADWHEMITQVTHSMVMEVEGVPRTAHLHRN